MTGSPHHPLDMATEVERYDWAATPLGQKADWPLALKVIVDLVMRSHFPKLICWGPEMTIVYNDAYVPLLGAKPFALGRPLRDIWNDVWDNVRPIAERAMAGHSTFVENLCLTTTRDGGERQAFFTFCYSPLLDEHGVIRGFLDTVIETTATVLAERRLKIVAGELQHRMKNAYAMASVIARQTLKAADSLQDASRTISARLQRLSLAQATLLDEAGEAEVGALIDRLLAPFAISPDRLRIQGHPLILPPAHIFPLSLAVGELATNAAKHGALSNDTGRIEISWSMDSDIFRFDWQERDGPVVAPPARRGFGSFLIEDALREAFGGEARIAFPPEGVTFTLRAIGQ
jgi:two-component sensor histidine kinase